jgi:hypothetical protein
MPEAIFVLDFPFETAVPELLHPGTGLPSGVFLKKTPPFVEARGARKLWNRFEVRTHRPKQP